MGSPDGEGTISSGGDAPRPLSGFDPIADVRLQIAQQLMRDTDLSIADIATTTCYSDVATQLHRGQSVAVLRNGLSPPWFGLKRSR
jgi:hypothetical protein